MNEKVTQKSRRPSWMTSRFMRGFAAIGAFFVAMLVYTAVPAQASDGSCTDTEIRNHMTCHTDPDVTKCVLSVAAGGIFGLAGGPIGFVLGVGAGIVNCGINEIG